MSDPRRIAIPSEARKAMRCGRAQLRSGTVTGADRQFTQIPPGSQLIFVGALADPALACSITIGNFDLIPIPAGAAFQLGERELRYLGGASSVLIGATCVSFVVMWV